MHSPRRGVCRCAREEKSKLSSAGLPRIPRELCNAQCDVRHRCSHDRTPRCVDLGRYIGRKYRSFFWPASFLAYLAALRTLLRVSTMRCQTRQASPSSRPLAAGVAPAGSRAEAVLAVLDRGVRWCSSRPHRDACATPS